MLLRPRHTTTAIPFIIPGPGLEGLSSVSGPVTATTIIAAAQMFAISEELMDSAAPASGPATIAPEAALALALPPAAMAPTTTSHQVTKSGPA